MVCLHYIQAHIHEPNFTRTQLHACLHNMTVFLHFTYMCAYVCMHVYTSSKECNPSATSVLHIHVYLAYTYIRACMHACTHTPNTRSTISETCHHKCICTATPHVDIGKSTQLHPLSQTCVYLYQHRNVHTHKPILSFNIRGT